MSVRLSVKASHVDWRTTELAQIMFVIISAVTFISDVHLLLRSQVKLGFGQVSGFVSTMSNWLQGIRWQYAHWSQHVWEDWQQEWKEW